MRGDSIRTKKDARRLVEGGREKAKCSREVHESRRRGEGVVIMKRRGGSRAVTEGERHDDVDDRERESTRKGRRKKTREGRRNEIRRDTNRTACETGKPGR